MNKPAAGFRDFPGRRWLIVALRALHLVGVVGVGAGLLAESPSAGTGPYLVALIASGLAMLLLDLWSAPSYLMEVAGAAMFLKLLLLAWLVAGAPASLPLFWTILVFSAVIAHAPARLRHRRLRPQ